MTARTAPGPARPRTRLAGLLLVLSGNMLLDALEVSVVVVALPTIARDLHLSVPGVQWMMTAFALGFGGLLLLGGRAVTVFGRRRAYLGALVGFALASILSGVFSCAPVLILARFVKGGCAALTAPTGLTIIATSYPEGPRRNRAIAVYSMFGAAGFTLGLLLSGVLSQVDWRWIFVFPAPVALLLLVSCLRLIPRDEPPPRPRPPADALGAITFTIAAILLVSAIVTSASTGVYALALSVSGLVAAGLVLVAFGAHERSAPVPLVRMALLRRAALLRSCAGAAALNGSYWGFLLICTFWAQRLAGWSPAATAAALLPAGLLLAVCSPAAGRLVARFGPARLIAAGALAPPLGYGLLLRHAGSSSPMPHLVPAVLLVGVGFVLSFAALHVQALTGVADADQRAVTGTYQTSVQIGGALVLAGTAALLRGVSTWATGTAPGAVRPALVLVTAIGVAGLLVALTGLRTRPEPAPTDRTDPDPTDPDRIDPDQIDPDQIDPDQAGAPTWRQSVRTRLTNRRR